MAVTPCWFPAPDMVEARRLILEQLAWYIDFQDPVQVESYLAVTEEDIEVRFDLAQAHTGVLESEPVVFKMQHGATVSIKLTVSHQAA